MLSWGAQYRRLVPPLVLLDRPLCEESTVNGKTVDSSRLGHPYWRLAIG
jgi:hypothetical protein